jgi:hypothetical protein
VHRLFVDNNVDIVAEIHWIGETPMRHDVERLATSLGARLRCWRVSTRRRLARWCWRWTAGPMSAPSRLCARHRWICRFPAGLLVNIVVDNSVDRA